MAATDYGSASETLADGEVATVEIDTTRADSAMLYVDAGTEGSTPARYTLRIAAFSPGGGSGLGRYQRYLDETGRTDRSWQLAATGATMRFEIENTSGGSAQFDVTAEARNN